MAMGKGWLGAHSLAFKAPQKSLVSNWGNCSRAPTRTRWPRGSQELVHRGLAATETMGHLGAHVAIGRHHSLSPADRVGAVRPLYRGPLSVLIVLLFLVAFLLLERQRRRKEEDLNSAMLESLPGMALLVNRQGDILRTNQMTREAAGLRAKVETGTTGIQLWRVFVQADRPRRRICRGGSYRAGDCRVRASATLELTVSAEERWLEVRAIQLPNQQSGSLVVHLDITQRKQSELERTRSRTEIYHLNRVAAIGQLAASLAHEFRSRWRRS